MSNDTDELVVRRFLEPLKTLEPVTPQPRTEVPRRWWGQAAEVAAVAIGVAVLVGVVALLAHRSPPTASPPPRSPEQLTYLHGGGIAVHDAGASTGVRLIVPFRQIVAFAWAPDGERVAYLTTVDSGRPTCALHIDNVAAKTTVVAAAWRPYAHRCEINQQLAWSPDGRHIAFERGRLVVVMDAGAKTQRVVGHAAAPGLSWWPGNRVAYMCKWVTWCAVGIDGTGRSRLPFHSTALVWSPAARRVAFLRDQRLHLQAWTARPNGSGARMLVAQPGVCCVTLPLTLAWSPDGTRLFVSGDEAQIVDVPSGQAHRLRWWQPSHTWSTPAWRPAEGR